MKCRMPTPLEKQASDRKKGRELIKQLRENGLTDKDIAAKLGVPYEKWTKFLWQIGMPFKDYPKRES